MSTEPVVDGRGLALARDTGPAEGSASGLAEGSAAGLAEGSAAGLAEGSAAGLAEGSAAGLAEGSAAGSGGAAEIDVTRLRVALARLSRRLRRHELAGLTPTQLAALSTIDKTGPMRLGDLAAAEGIAPSTLTRLVTALEDSGYVQRTADPSDARASTLAITAHGQEALERIRTETTLMLTASLELLTAEQRSALAAALPVLEQLAEAQGAPGSRLLLLLG